NLILPRSNFSSPHQEHTQTPATSERRALGRTTVLGRRDTMRSQWNDQESPVNAGALAQRVYTSRLLGRDPSLVLHGGGTTSVKIGESNLFGEEEDILYVKGSGWDLATIETAGFAPVRMRHLLRLAELDSLSDLQMANELRQATTTPSAPAPSVEAILHAILPYTFVDHTHADAFIAATNTPDGRDNVRRIYG